MAASHTPRPPVLAVLIGLAGAVVAAVLGLLTFGAQATVHPDHLPLALAVPSDAGQLRAVADRVAGQGGDAVSWRVTTPDEARKLLDDKEIYGFLEAVPGSGGAPTARIVVSGAVNAQGTQFAQGILAEVARALSQGVGAPPVETVHPASVAGRTAPLAASALLWIAGLVATLGFGMLTTRRGIRAGLGSRSILAVTVSLASVAAMAGFFRLWDDSLPLTADVLGFLLLTAVAFAAIQGALFRLLRIRAAAILGPLYLIAPAVAGQVPELLNPAYRALLWSWTPFRFSTEGLRSLLQGTPSAPDVRLGLIVLGSMAVIGLVIMLWPGRSRPVEEAQPDPADGVVDVRVDQADRLPRAEGELTTEDGNGGVRRYERR
jgi:hypothetical protein